MSESNSEISETIPSNPLEDQVAKLTAEVAELKKLVAVQPNLPKKEKERLKTDLRREAVQKKISSLETDQEATIGENLELMGLKIEKWALTKPVSKEAIRVKLLSAAIACGLVVGTVWAGQHTVEMAQQIPDLVTDYLKALGSYDLSQISINRLLPQLHIDGLKTTITMPKDAAEAFGPMVQAHQEQINARQATLDSGIKQTIAYGIGSTVAGLTALREMAKNPFRDREIRTKWGARLGRVIQGVSKPIQAVENIGHKENK